MRSFELALGTFFLGAIFLIASFVLGILSFDVCWGGGTGPADYRIVSCAGEYALKKQVGFGLALNWSVGLCLLLPFFVFCASETIRHGFGAIGDMTHRKMFVYDDWTPATADVITNLIRKRQTIIAITVVGMIALLTTVFIATDFFKAVGKYYSTEAMQSLAQQRLVDREFEADWSIAAPVCRFTNDPTEPCATIDKGYALNAVFAGAVYIYLPFVGAIAAISFMVAFGLFVRFVFAADLRGAGIRVVPDLNSTDKRVGFEALEDFFVYAFVSCFILFAMGYLVTLQNVYLRTDSPNILQFIIPLVPTKISWDPGEIGTAIQNSVSFTIVNGNSIAVTMLGFLFLGIVLLSAAAVLGSEAKRGRDLMLKELAKPTPLDPKFAALLGSLKAKAATEKLDSAEFWPLRWPSVNVVLVFTGLAQLSLLFVVVGFYIVTAGLFYVFRQAFKRSAA